LSEEAFSLDGGGGSSAEQLKSLFQRLRALDDERLEIAGLFNDVVAEAKALGFEGKILRKMVIRARHDPADVEEADQLLETYEAITGSGAGAAGTLTMEKGADGIFKPKMVQGGAEAEEKLSRSARARRSAVTLAEMSERARES
jgi:uncharacterized protein (UPF0335 family)